MEAKAKSIAAMAKHVALIQNVQLYKRSGDQKRTLVSCSDVTSFSLKHLDPK